MAPLVINYVAVIGTTFFILALQTLWYSSYGFGTLLARTNGSNVPPTPTSPVRQLLTFFQVFLSYGVVFTLLALCVPYTTRLGLTVFEASVLLSLLVFFLNVSSLNFGHRVTTRFFVDQGFMLVCVMVGTMLLYYWPW